MVGTKNINLELHKEEIAPKQWEKLYSKHHSEEMRCSTANQAGVSIYRERKLKYRWHLIGSKARMMPQFAMKEKHQDMLILRSRQYYKLPC